MRTSGGGFCRGCKRDVDGNCQYPTIAVVLIVCITLVIITYLSN